jgi:hypothetical protein
MGSLLKIYLTVIVTFCGVMLGQAENVFSYRSNKTDVAELRKLFTEAVGGDFEIVKDILNKRPDPRGGETYWLVHVKPRRSGHFALKYSFKFTHKFEYPEEGENELFIRVGGKNCNRYNNDNLGLGNVCLGDTVIVPIRTDFRTGHLFSLKSTYQEAENIGRAGLNPEPSEKLSNIEPVVNPLENNLKYLGMMRSVMPHRNYGAETVVYRAFFEAKKVGRFNLGLATGSGDEKAVKTINIGPLDALPIIIVDPGTPITALVYAENTVNYGDKKRFSAYAGNNFLTKLLILQPGDVFSVEYASWTNRWDFGDEKKAEQPDPKLAIHKLPFTVDKDWSYNEWLIDYLPAER